jgi:hypothetical protein
MSGMAASGSRDQGLAKRIFLIKKKKYFLCSKKFILLSHIKGNSKKEL